MSALALRACSGSPTQPPPPPDPPKISCPAPVTLLSPLASPISVVYGTPTSVGGTQPVTIACTPQSGSIFQVGSTSVACTATDARQRTDSCTFAVTVKAPPKIGATSYVAFGDSLTAGEIVSEGSGYVRTLRVDAAKAYPADLQRNLQGRYTQQAGSIYVDNQGRSGESAVTGASRLRGLLGRGNYEVLTLMDGDNDLADRDWRVAEQGLSAMRSMVRDAKSRGVKVFLATLPPQNPNGCCPDRGLSASMVERFNDGIRDIASSEGVPLVDVFQAFGGDITTLIDSDGLHPTADGYQKIADTFFNVIARELEQPAAASLSSPFELPMFARPRRR